MPEFKKIDYRELASESPQTAPIGESAQEGMPAGEQKTSFFASLGDRWALMDKKTKLEVFVFSVVMIAIIGVLIFYFVSVKKPEFRPPASYSRPAIE